MKENGQEEDVYTEYVTQPMVFTTPVLSSPKHTILASREDFDSVFKYKDKRKVVLFLRSQHWMPNNEIRKLLWNRLCQHMEKSPAGLYRETVRDLFGHEHKLEVTLPGFIDPTSTLHYYLNEEGQQCAKRIVCILGYMCPDITYSPSILALTSLFLHYMPEDEAYNCIYGLVHSKAGHISQTKMSYEAGCLVLRDLAKKYAKPAYTYLTHCCAQNENIFEQWMWWLLRDLPFTYLVRVVDSYIYEGPKVLYRAALAILILFGKHAVKDLSTNSKASAELAVSQFIQEITVPLDKFFKIAFGIRGLKRKDIEKLTVKHDMFLKSKVHANNVHGLFKAKSSDSLPGLKRNISHIQQPYILQQTHSSIINKEQLQAIWSWLPSRMAVYQPELLYTTEEHGTSLKTLYTRTENKGPTLLIVKTETNEIFGAYCSSDWSERTAGGKNLTYFGTGETFIFTLNPEPRKYDWIGIDPDNEIVNTANMFLAGDNSMLTVGGGSGEALQLDENLFQGRTETCDTFKNPPLVDTGDFHCKVIEVFGFS